MRLPVWLHPTAVNRYSQPPERTVPQFMSRLRHASRSCLILASRALVIACLVSAAALVPAWADPNPTPVPTVAPVINDHVTIAPATTSLKSGEYAQFTATLYDSNGGVVTGVPVIWSALAQAGTVSATGRFYATGKPGLYEAAVSATMAGLTGTADLQITRMRLFLASGFRAYSSQRVPNDTMYSQQWAYAHINATQAWYTSIGDSGPIIAVLDTGVDLTHPDLVGNLVPGATFTPSTGLCPTDGNSAQDTNGHGTHVAGIIGATGNNGLGVTGVNWHARIMPVKVLDCTGSGSGDVVQAGIHWAVDNGAKVISLSLGAFSAQSPSPLLEEGIGYAISKGVVVVAAAGNLSPGITAGTPSWPAAYPGVVGVGATESSDRLTSFSNTGYFVDVVAPGYNILSTYPRNIDPRNLTGYQYESGTSMATPFVSGLAGLIWAASPSLFATDVTGDIQLSARDLGSAGWDPSYGYGLIDASAAMRRLGQPKLAALPSQAGVAVSAQAAADTPPLPGTYRAGELLVRLKAGESLKSLAQSLSVQSITGQASSTSLPDVVRLRVPVGHEVEYMRKLAGQAGVDRVYLDVLLFAQ
jgi:hypothetical protein